MARTHFSVLLLFIACAACIPIYVYADTLTNDERSCIADAAASREAEIKTAAQNYFDVLENAYTVRASAYAAAYTHDNDFIIEAAEKIAHIAFSASAYEAYTALKQAQLAAEDTFVRARLACVTGESLNGDENGNAGGGNGNGEETVVLFSDDFNRGDSGEVGNGWNVRSEGSGTSQGIENNTYISRGSWNGASFIDRNDIIVGDQPFSIYTEFSSPNLISGRSGWELAVGYLGNPGRSAAAYGYGVHILAGDTPELRIQDNGATKASTDFTFTNNDIWALEIDYTGETHLSSIYVWNVTNGETRPEMPALSWEGENSSYTPVAAGSAFYVAPVYNGSGTASAFLLHNFRILSQ